ncbi:DUF2147 domain-containing protein [Aquabacterium sp.]|uniref:DUF2147 domain-containing protein n=1 Tax=Aquabacterium sp. TaxID=1872578 RepID=UPI002E33BCB5|nr:DUF2147 domain-containing protein [Aquabacterium sp.]HEX5312518.1 DUF2147 domain-containing protein [Aquabacterium sp.]
MVLTRFALALSGLTLSSVLWAQTTPAGSWLTYDDKTGEPTSHVRVSEKEGSLMGAIEKILDPAKADAICNHCDDERKDQPILGMVIFSNVKLKDDAPLTWDGGDILDPKNGKIYKVRIRLVDDGKTLEVRGYKGSPMFGRTQLWHRIDTAPATATSSSASTPAAGTSP